MRRFVLFVAPLLIAGNPAAGQIAGEPVVEPFPTTESRPFNFWMDVKLKKSQEIFAALTEADYETITDCAKQLHTLGEFEGFVRKGTPGYVTQLRSFQFAVAEIEKQAKQENIEGVTLGFQQLTLSCVHCHIALRQESAATGSIPASHEPQQNSHDPQQK
ncbi:hypothetical protein [Bythopirellula polymerisocia]|uniref:Cytochrome C n=1 Tax=Bythopirellula polymerisocia TaxID=2528003 RepID=A0A5C6CNZ9_9BACT|nr:hypothetical protein [Bythopirellula polymerisocia]TWU25825.1 hypothetical protein Pla144_30370 [Bythopirellula polymerisocia]